MFKLTFLFKLLQACRIEANGIKPGSDSKMTDKHDAEFSKTLCLGVN